MHILNVTCLTLLYLSHFCKHSLLLRLLLNFYVYATQELASWKLRSRSFTKPDLTRELETGIKVTWLQHVYLSLEGHKKPATLQSPILGGLAMTMTSIGWHFKAIFNLERSWVRCKWKKLKFLLLFMNTIFHVYATYFFRSGKKNQSSHPVFLPSKLIQLIYMRV